MANSSCMFELVLLDSREEVMYYSSALCWPAVFVIEVLVPQESIQLSKVMAVNGWSVLATIESCEAWQRRKFYLGF